MFNFENFKNTSYTIPPSPTYSLQQKNDIIRDVNRFTNTSRDDLGGQKRKRGSIKEFTFDPGCQPATIESLKQTYMYRHGIHGSQVKDCPYSVIGWVFSINIVLTPNECRFKVSDGSGTALVLMDIPSTSEEWLHAKLKKILKADTVEDSENIKNLNDTRITYVRIVGTLSSEKINDCITLHALHISNPNFEEIAYYHFLSCCWTIVKDKDKFSDGSLLCKKDSKELHLASSLDGVSLPPSHRWCTNSYEIALLKYMVQNRAEPWGIPIVNLYDGLEMNEKEEVDRAMKDLIDAALIYVPLDGWLDLLLEEKFDLIQMS